LQIDNSSSATHQIGRGQERVFNREFVSICEHYGLTPRTIGISCPNENGDVESSNGHLKRRLKQHLLLRGSSDFSLETDYEQFYEKALEQANARRGEAVAEVTATGTRTKFGHTAELVRTAHVISTQQKVVFRVVRNLALFNSGVIVLLVSYAWAHAMPIREMVPMILTAVLTSIPVALPATFTLAAAVGARALAKLGVLPAASVIFFAFYGFDTISTAAEEAKNRRMAGGIIRTTSVCLFVLETGLWVW